MIFTWFLSKSSVYSDPGIYLFPSVHLSRVEQQVTVLVFTSSIKWLEANMFIKVYGLHSLTKHIAKCIMQEDNEHDEYAVNNLL